MNLLKKVLLYFKSSKEADTRTERRKIGDKGEDVACMFLVEHGYKVVERNFLRKCGEIDIVASYKGKTVFVEVKTVSCDTSLFNTEQDGYRPEDNLHPWKLERMKKVIQVYLNEKDKGVDGLGIDTCRREEGDWQFDAITVLLDLEAKKAKVNHLKDIILD